MYETASTYLWIIPTAPFLAGLLTFIIGPKFRRYSYLPCILSGILSFVCALIVFKEVHSATKALDIVNPPSVSVSYFEWFRTGDPNLVGDGWRKAGGLRAEFSLRLDPLSASMALMVSFLGTVIAFFATGYLRDHHGKCDPGYPRFFAEVALFLGSMLLLVLADNLVLLYAGWEGVGLCSYLLIGFWFEKPSAARAARKAFLVTRLGDVALFLGFAVLWVHCGCRLDFESILNPENFTGGLGLACLLLFLGACGKSAQFPLHVWLPDAMEGPTPVSALIHAATMVTAGVYLLARFMPLFASVADVQMAVTGIAAITSLMAAWIALFQTDLKRILAYSTMSQLGYMFMALGSGFDSKSGLPFLAFSAAMFHLMTHAFFKALLFLSAGSVLHSMHHVGDLRRIGGLRKVLPITHLAFLFGALALAGVPPFAGFWSKDEILSVVHAASGQSAFPWFYILVWIVGIFTAFLTALYTFRAYFLVFHGPLKLPEEVHGQASESPWTLTCPLIILAVFALFAGWLLAPDSIFSLSSFLSHVPGLPHVPPQGHDWLTVGLATSAGLGGVALAWFKFGKNSGVVPFEERTGIWAELGKNKFYFDELFSLLIVHPLQWLFLLWKVLDHYLLDGIVDLLAHFPRLLAGVFKPMQNGLVQFYALAMLLALTVFLLALSKTM
ncbi:MAG: NADH-quinone oxidoreductase subunit L [Gemmataceae bacterium]|nr:NADH-quinone oxidoreductase subunit L [Gemmataceae bacterium]